MKSEPVGGGAERTDLFVVERNNGEWVNACDGTDYSCFLSLSEAEEALKAEADNCEEGESLYRIVRFTRVGASLSAHEITYDGWAYLCKTCRMPITSVSGEWKHLVLGGAAQEGDCPCGATVVRKSDSANKSKLCAERSLWKCKRCGKYQLRDKLMPQGFWEPQEPK